jgi:glycine cleavage system H protein
LNDKWWVSATDDPTIFNIGLTQQALQRYGVIWNLVPRDLESLERGKPFLNIESSRALCPMMAPISGKIRAWNEALWENPDQITEHTFIVRVQT